ncbi:signal transduction histidine kinase [Marisediminicola sp. UYEF4]|uniref:sensor histidine kinase n=1 Tax=Marisediminicola sp. UYEF4 TaxID=1756384 RepID=UPI003397783B
MSVLVPQILRPSRVGGGLAPSVRWAAFIAAPSLKRDLCYAVVFLAIWLGTILLARGLGWYPVELDGYISIGLIGAAAFALSRIRPVIGIVVVGLLTTNPAWSFDVPEMRAIPFVIAAYLSTSAGLRLAVAAPLILVFTVAALLPFLPNSDLDPGYYIESIVRLDPSSRILSGVPVVAALLLGRSAKVQRVIVEALRQRNDELLRLREADRARIATEERTAIAREIHDVVAHHVSAIVVRAQAAVRISTLRPGELAAANELRDTVAWIATSGQHALIAMRKVVKVLRTDGRPSALTPMAFPASLNEVVAHVRETGLAIETSLAVDTPLTTMQEFAVLRISQEALSNVLLHSTATRVRVGVRTVDDRLELRIEDDGAPAERLLPVGESARVDGGEGVRGMRERAEALGGTLVAGKGAGRGWVVEAVLPLGAGGAE